MKTIFLPAVLLGCGILSLPAGAQSAPQPGPPVFPLAGDWQGATQIKGTVYHLVLHMNTTPEGKMTALLDSVDQDINGIPAIGGSFDGSHLILHFFHWVPNAKGVLEYKVEVYDAAVSASGAEMKGTWTDDGSSQLDFKRVTWQARNPKPAPPTILDGDWAGTEYESEGIKLHFILHIFNTEDGLMALLDCPEEKFKGARASKVSFDPDSRRFSITLGQSIFAGTMTADGKALDTSMTEPGFHFLIHFDRVESGKSKPN